MENPPVIRLLFASLTCGYIGCNREVDVVLRECERLVEDENLVWLMSEPWPLWFAC
jgi:hypothetical protein